MMISDYAGTIISTDNTPLVAPHKPNRMRYISDQTNAIGLFAIGMLSYLCPIALVLGLCCLCCYRTQMGDRGITLSDRASTSIGLGIILIGLSLVLL